MDEWPGHVSACCAFLSNFPPAQKHSAQTIETLLDIRSFHYKCLKLPQVVRVLGELAHFFNERLELAEHCYVLAVGIHKHLLINTAVVYKGRGHIPVRSDHSVVRASIVSATKDADYISSALRIEVGEVPPSRAPKPLFASQLIQLQNQRNVLMFIAHLASIYVGVMIMAYDV